MNPWLQASLGLLIALAVCGVAILRAPKLGDALVALQLASLMATLALVTLTQALERPSFLDLGLGLALLGFPSGVLFAHFVERSDR